MKEIILTGITPTGMPHLGNYIGAFKTALAYQDNPNVDALYFVADAHSLVKLWDAKLRATYIFEVAASWLALGLDPTKVTFYRQSDISEIFELAWILTTVTAKGLMNRAHAYKDQWAKNLAEGTTDQDAGITMGLYSYPILMAADILLFNPDFVPVGKDQMQHLEMARDIASRFNHVYGEIFKLPQAMIDQNSAVLPGLDGRKMSKSYHNTIPLFVNSKDLRKLIMKIKTNSLLPGEPKDPQNCTVFSLYAALATPDATAEFRHAYEQGISWGDAKQILFELLDDFLTEPREKFEYYYAHQNEVRSLLEMGADKARVRAHRTLIDIKRAAGFTL